MKPISNRLNSFRYAIRGIKAAFRSEFNFRIHCSALAAVVFSGWYFSISAGEWIAVIMVSGIVLITELINTSIETLTNLVMPHQHELAGKTKDIAAGGVLIAALTAFATGMVIFLPKIYSLFSSLS